MTVIAYRDGLMAADSGSWAGDAAHGWARKLAKGPDGTLYGVAGNAAQCTAFLDWVEGGCVGAQPVAQREGQDGRDSSFIALAVPRQGRIRLITAHGEEKYDAPYYAIGAGALCAYGALFAGATAEMAIEACKEHATGAFGRVSLIMHQDRA
jgi:ATP-dependent HslUV protease subunit HslV